MPVQIRFSDVDQFGHMNNSVLLFLCMICKDYLYKRCICSADWSKLAIMVCKQYQCKLLYAGIFSDHLVIRNGCGTFGHKSFYFVYSVP